MNIYPCYKNYSLRRKYISEMNNITVMKIYPCDGDESITACYENLSL